MGKKNRKSVKAKIVQAKIPLAVKEQKAIASGRFAVFTSLLKMGEVMVALENAFEKKKGVPVSGYVQIGEGKTYYCLYGFVGDDSVYEDK